MHMFRIFFCKIFNLAIVHASATNPDDFFKPIHLYSLIFIGAVCIPTMASNVYYIVEVWNGNEFWDN